MLKLSSVLFALVATAAQAKDLRLDAVYKETNQNLHHLVGDAQARLNLPEDLPLTCEGLQTALNKKYIGETEKTKASMAKCQRLASVSKIMDSQIDVINSLNKAYLNCGALDIACRKTQLETITTKSWELADSIMGIAEMMLVQLLDDPSSLKVISERRADIAKAKAKSQKGVEACAGNGPNNAICYFAAKVVEADRVGTLVNGLIDEINSSQEMLELALFIKALPIKDAGQLPHIPTQDI